MPRVIEVRRYKTGWGVWINHRRLDIPPRTRAQADRIASDMRGACDHKFEKVGTGFYVCRKCSASKVERGSVWSPR